MKTPFASLVICVFASSAFASGVLVDAKGQLKVTMPDGRSAPAKLGVELPDGTKIAAGGGAAASVMLMDGSICEISAGQDYTVGEAPKGGGQKTVIEGIALAMNEATEASSGPTVHGMVKMGRLGPGAPKRGMTAVGTALGPPGIYPVETIIELPPKILFRWRGGVKFANPVIVVEEPRGQKVLTEKLAPNSSQVEVAASKLKLKAGDKFSWYLASDEDGKISGKSRRFNFGILSDGEKTRLLEDRQKIEAMKISPDARQFLIAQLYYRAGMNEAMVGLLLPLWQKYHSDAVKKLLFWGYARMAQTDEAKKFE